MKNEQKNKFWELLGLFFLFLFSGFCMLGIIQDPVDRSSVRVQVISGIFFLLMAGFFVASFYFGWQMFQEGFRKFDRNNHRADIQKSLDEIQQMRGNHSSENETSAKVASEFVRHSYSSTKQKPMEKGNSRKYRAKNR